MRSFFKQDNMWLGAGIGIAGPVLFFFAFRWINSFFPAGVLAESTIQLIAICINVLSMRYYLLRVKADRTGRGILLVTFIFAIVYFYFNLGQ